MRFLYSSLTFLLPAAVAAVGADYEADVSSGCIEACSRLASRHDFVTHFPGNGNFSVWDLKQQEVQSACRVLPTSTEGVAAILQTLIDTSCRFSVKGGGHARDPDDSVSVGGVTIDLVKMRSIEVSRDRKTARVGSGHVLHSLYSGLEEYNLTTVGGRVADVGLGGYALGGGLSRLSARYGLAMDNIYEYEIVLPNATIATITEQTSPDLYFALRGGMNNFGIITHFTMRAVSQGRVYGGQRTYAADKRGAILSQAYQLTTTWKNETAMTFYYRFIYDPKVDNYTLALNQEFGRPIMNPPPFAALNQIPFESSTLRLDWTSNFSLDGVSPPGGRNLYATITYSPSEALDRTIQDILVREAQSVKGIVGLQTSLVIQPIYEAAVRNGKERGGNAAGIESDGPLTVVLFSTRWVNAEDDDKANAFARSWVKRAVDAATAAGKHNRWLYINYASKDQDPFAGYGVVNKRRLESIQKAVDPKGIFSSRGLCRGYFKLS